jgi:hypothetical protein
MTLVRIHIRHMFAWSLVRVMTLILDCRIHWLWSTQVVMEAHCTKSSGNVRAVSLLYNIIGAVLHTRGIE